MTRLGWNENLPKQNFIRWESFFFTNAIQVKDLIIFEVYFGKPFNFTIMASDIKINVKLKAMFKYQQNIINILFVLR